MLVYVFEARGIQRYLLSSGKLKDAVAASERLERLIDDDNTSLLAQVLQQWQQRQPDLSHDLFLPEVSSSPTLRFIRCKGGAFYVCSHDHHALTTLRSLWTLTVQQAFPGLRYAEGLGEGETLSEALQQAHQRAAGHYQLPTVPLPLAFAPCASAPRTGLPVCAIDSATQEELDLDVMRHRSAHPLPRHGQKNAPAQQDGRKSGLLQKFTTTPDNRSFCSQTLNFPLDTDDFPAFAQPEATRDLALIHLDGNGIGQVLRGLRDALAGADDGRLIADFREFSTRLAQATRQSACIATQWLYQQQLSQQPLSQQQQGNEPPTMLAIRPLVLGGDDITLLCQADLALGFARQFCLAFRQQTQLTLHTLHQSYPSLGLDKLSASGGVLFHKSHHPFVLCHQQVESLCQEAKHLSKQHNNQAALAFYRLNQALTDHMSQLRQHSQSWRRADSALSGSLGAYWITDDERKPQLAHLQALVEFLRQPDGALTIGKLRQMAHLLDKGDSHEAERLYQRAISLLSGAQKVQWEQHLTNLMGETGKTNWYQQTAPQQAQTFLADALIYASQHPDNGACHAS
ncbi:hypothetical protein KSI86_16405 [Dickeya oryzae]|uniref:Cas10/Cmr2 second palm domain-containing protein n=1 Tax=Dickeya oryzae TaxID=1240404 RepID=UPI002097498D|nr:hypothetical protein [Dickeya oryzae]MCO7255742.1 hypothetical protein [Dickeya oryzae]